MVLYWNPALHDSHNLNLEEWEVSSDILDDPLLGSPGAGGRRGGCWAPPALDSIPTSPESPASSEPPSPDSPTSPKSAASPGPFDQSQIPPLYSCPFSSLPKGTESSPSGVTCSGVSYHSGPEKSCHFREVVNAEGTSGCICPSL